MRAKALLQIAAVLVLVVVGFVRCSSKKSGTTVTSDLGVCADTCPKICNVDNDCDVTRGELCCDHGNLGKICQSAASCPRFCTSDQQCQTTQSEACVRFSLDVTTRICELPKDGITICSNDQGCKTGEKCCGIYSEQVCLPVNLCPKTCKTGSDCDTADGEICCTTLNGLDHTITATGLCIDPNVVSCPRLCTQSSMCRTQDGEVCCNGICSKSCATKTCKTSNDCQAQICCKSALTAEGAGVPSGVPVPVHATGTGGVTGGAGGQTGAGGSGASGGSSGGAGGSSSGAGGSTGGSGGSSGPSSPDCVTSSNAIDDMENGTGHICPQGGRTGFWFSYKDASSTLAPTGAIVLPVGTSPARGNSLRAMEFVGTEVQYAGIGCYLNFDPNATLNPGTYNGRAFTGIEFYARGLASAPIVIVQTSSTEQDIYGGTCTLGTSCAGNQAILSGLSSTDWTLYRVPFAVLAGGSSAFDAGMIWSIEFQPGVGSYDLSIDDLAFY
jgi:uncharacterized membrane protein YgcG